MMIQAASRQPSSSLHQHQQHQHQQHYSIGGGSSSYRQRLPQLQSQRPPVKSNVLTLEEANQRSGRLASALLFMAVLVLMVDASRIILYSWYTDGSYLKYLYGSDPDIRWSKCDDQSPDVATTPASGLSAVITAVSQRQQRRQQQQQPEDLDQFKAGLMNGLLLAGTIIDSAVESGDSLMAQARTRQLAKPVVRVLFHASTVACLFLLSVAIFPAALRSRRGRCLLSCSLLFSLATLLAAGASVAASFLTLFFFSASELQPQLRQLYSFVPRCDALRRAFLGAECFSLIVVCAAVCILLRLKVFFCRALCSRCCSSSNTCCGCCCCCCGDDGDPGDGGNGDVHIGGVVGYRDDVREFPLARRSLGGGGGGGGGYPYDEEEYLA